MAVCLVATVIAKIGRLPTTEPDHAKKVGALEANLNY